MARVSIDFTRSRGIINPNIYGHFAEHIGGVFYDGLWVGEDSAVENTRGFRKALVDSFRKINPPVLRWPGGCFAETYDWRDGIGPRERRPTRVNWWYSSDKRTESNQVGTHEFMDFCRMVGAEPYFAANMTSTTPLHIRNWIEYCNFPSGTTLSEERAQNGDAEPFGVRYWGIGNENWGGGGQMSPEECAKEFIKYATVCDSLDKGGNRFILCGANGHDLQWTRRLLAEYNSRKTHDVTPYGMSVHYYCGGVGDPVAFTQQEWYRQLFQADYMRRVVDDHRAVMDEFDPQRRMAILVDEWGCWHPEGSGPSRGYNLFEQQSTMRDAIVAAMTLNLFNNRCDVVAMANVAQLCNNLHSLFLAGADNFVQTPNYHVFDLFKTHQGAKHLHTTVAAPSVSGEGFQPLCTISASASQTDAGLTITLANLNMTQAQSVTLEGIGGDISGEGVLRVLSAEDPHAHNTFGDPAAVAPTMDERAFADGGSVEVPAAGVVSILIRRGA